MTTTLLNNRYQIIQLLGTGGFGETFLAEDTYLPSRRCCVIKQLKPVANDPQRYQLIQQRFQREAATLETLGEGSDQIPKLYAYFSENGQFYLVQEWIQGQTLSSKVAAEGPLNETVVKEILINLLHVLNYVHSKAIIYRDIKPDNIILRQLNNQPVLIDFGAVKETMATAIDAQGKSIYTMVVGTPGFMAPEQAVGRPAYASDIYSLGMTAIYLLTGKLPQELEIDPQTEQILWQSQTSKVSSSLADVLNKAIQYQPRDRYTTAIKMLSDLQAIATSPPRQPSTRNTVFLSPAHQQVFTKPGAENSTQTVPVKHLPSNQRNWQKNLILGGLLVGVLSATAVVALMRNQSPQPTSEQPTAQSTPTVAESPKPALEADNAPSTSVSTESPAVDEASQSENQLQQNTEPTSSPVDSASQPENQPQNIADGEESTQPEDEREEEAESKPGNQSQATDSLQSRNHSEQPKGSTGSADRNSLPGFPIGTDEGTVKSALGEPTKTSRGVWRNTRAAIYDIKPNRITLGYLFDRKSGQLRQTEVSFAQSVEPEVMQATLQRMLGSNASGEIEQGLQQVYQRRTNKYSFNVGELKGTIERNYRDRIYIGVWDADLH